MISFKGRQFDKQMILRGGLPQSVRWYLAYSLSYRNLEEMEYKEACIVANKITIRKQAKPLQDWIN